MDTIKIMHNELNNRPASDSGRVGKAFEIAVRSYIARRTMHGVKPQGKIDIRATHEGLRVNCEIKTACGEIDLTTPYKYLVYCPYVDIDTPAEVQGYVFSREEWYNFVNGYTGRGQFLRVDKARGHLHIQSFYVSEEVRPKASKPIARYIAEVVSHQPTIEEFFKRGNK